MAASSCWFVYCWMMPLSWFFFCVCVSATPLAVAAATLVDTSRSSRQQDDHKFAALVDWVRTNGGRVDERLVLANNQYGIRGGMASTDIPASTELLFLPWKLVLGTEGDTHKILPEDHCEAMHAYANEIRAGKDSFWYHYLAMDDSLGSRMPAVWDESILYELQGLPPFQSSMNSNLANWYSTTCAGEEKTMDELDEAARRSLLAAISRAAQRRFLPIYDLLNHDNGNLNTRLHAENQGCIFEAAVNIPAGSEIFISYSGGRATSADVFQRYGFVEAYPQQWTWSNDESPNGEERFLVLSHGVIVISPSDAMTSDIGTTAEILGALEKHASLLSTQQKSDAEVERFLISGRNLLRSLHSTVEQDDAIIQRLQKRLSIPSQDATEVRHYNDWISAVSYRKYFKEAIHAALEVAESTLTPRSTSEL